MAGTIDADQNEKCIDLSLVVTTDLILEYSIPEHSLPAL